MLDRIPKLTLPATAILILGMIVTLMSDLADPDYFWHLRAGQWVIENGRLPVNDPFLWSQANTPWLHHGWLSDIGMFWIHTHVGSSAFSALIGLLFTLTLGVMYWFSRQYAPEFISLLLVSLGAGVILPWAGARPQSVTYLFFAFFLAVLLRFKDKGQTKWIWVLPVSIILWANLHGGYIMGIVLIGMVAGLMLLEGLWESPSSWLAALKATGPLWICMLLAIVAACINPYKVDLLILPFKALSQWIIPYIAEWHPPRLGDRGSSSFFVLLALWTLMQIYRASKPSLFELGLPLVFILMGLAHARHAPLFAIILTAFNARTVMDIWPTLVNNFTRKFGISPIVSRATQDIGVVQYLINWALVLTALGATAYLLPNKVEAQLKAHNEIIGYSAIEYLTKHPAPGPIFNQYGFGGYLTWRLWPEQRAFIDGRSDMFSDQFSKDYFAIIGGEPDWEKKFDLHQFNTVVIGKANPLRQLLILKGQFSETFADDKLTILVRKNISQANSAGK